MVVDGRFGFAAENRLSGRLIPADEPAIDVATTTRWIADALQVGIEPSGLG